MHACSSSRPLSNKHSSSAGKKLHFIKVWKVKRMLLHSTTFNPSKEKEVKVIKHHSTTDHQKTKENSSSEDLKSSTKEVEAKKKMKINPADAPVAQRDQSLVSVYFRVPRKKQGSEVIMSYDDVGLRHWNIEGSEMKAQSVLGSTDPHSTEETINSKENGVDHDVVAMDYEPPHRRPPIHNLSP
ncbi:hypothetical protein FRX31_033250 [Thalictrum thalictroides]|uniref:Uncharacterized protein n=1 Tax=Thalictrum thalictroides TaxID=46969 RepID=A0A7J6UXF2_THATH|nr:hypothetical protein FRX31_033250 [Thalictrum thalictroides]